MKFAPKDRSLCDWPLIAVMAALVLALTIPAPAQTTLQTPAVWRQKMDSATTWVGRGVGVFVCYEPQGGTVSMASWRAGVARAGGKYVCEPSGDWAADNADANLLAILSWYQELDNSVVSAQDAPLDAAAKAKAIESLYVGQEEFYKLSKAKAPAKPVALVVGLEQFRWGKADYARLAAACDWLIVDWYPIHRGLTPADLAALLDKFAAGPGKGKLKYVCVECSAQHLDPAAYPKQRCPTEGEMLAELANNDARGLGSCLFPQQTAEDFATNPAAKFLYDMMPRGPPNDLVGPFTRWSRGRTPTPPAVVKGPLDGKVITVDGFNYTLTSK